MWYKNGFYLKYIVHYPDLDFVKDILKTFKNVLQVSAMLTFSVFALIGCGGGSSGNLDDLAGGSEDIDSVTIVQFLPTSTDVIIEQGYTQDFTVVAKAPPAQSISYRWTIDGVVVSEGSSAIYSIIGDGSNIGSHVLEVRAFDSSSSDTLTWNIKVNGPPVLTPVTTGTPKVSVDSTVDFEINAVDPNNDTLTYVWLLNGLPSDNLVATDNIATLTGEEFDVGSVNITVTVSDDSSSDSYTWTAEVNHFPQACNELEQGQACTYAGSPSIGNGFSPNVSQQGIRVGPISTTIDELGNLIIADYYNNVIWYWNRSITDALKFNVNVPAGELRVIAGTGEAASGADGLGIQTSMYNPRGLAYDSLTQTLYISEWSSHRIKALSSSGVITTFMGAGSSDAAGGTAYSQRCNNPAGLFIYNGYLYTACYGTHRVKRVDLNDNTTYTVVGTGSGSLSGNNTVLPSNFRNPYGLFVTADGIYVTAYNNHVIRFANTSGSAKTFWGVTVNPNRISTIIGTGGGGTTTNVVPTSLRIANPTSIIVIGEHYFFSSIESNRDGIFVANNTGSAQIYGDYTVANGIGRRLTYHTGGNNMAGYNGTGVIHSSARINNPYDLVYDAVNNDLIFSDYSNFRVRKLDMDDYKIYDLVGVGQLRYGFVGDVALPSLKHLFQRPGGVAYDPNSRILFFIDSNNYRIRKVGPYGRVSTALGKGAGDPVIDNDIPSNALLRTNVSGNSYASGLAITESGSLIQVNSQGHNVRMWNRSGTSDSFFGTYINDDSVSTIAGDYIAGLGDGPTGPALNAQLNYPTGVAVKGAGILRELFIADQRNHCIRRVDDNGDLTTVVGICGSTANGTSNLGDATTVTLNRPNQIAFDANGNLFIADTYNHKIRFVNLGATTVNIANVNVPAGSMATVACNNGTTGSASENVLSVGVRCYYPYGVAVYGSKFCFSNSGRHNVRCVDISTGITTTVAGSYESTPQAGSPVDFTGEGAIGTDIRLYNPRHIAFDEVGDLYISDQDNHIVRKIKLSP